MGVDVVRTPLTHARGYTNGWSVIWVHDGLTPVEERVTVTHELVHITQGHTGEQCPETEELVQKITARWLVPWHRLATAWEEGRTVKSLADELIVTPNVIRDRLAHATPEELWVLEEREVSCCWLAA